MLETLGRVISRHPWVVIVTWLIAFVIAIGAAFGGLFGQPLFDRLSNGEVAIPGQTQDGSDLIASLPKGAAGPSVILLLDHVDPTSDVLKAGLDSARKDLKANPAVLSIRDPYAKPLDAANIAQGKLAGKIGELYDADSYPLLSEDKTAVLMVVVVKRKLSPEASEAAMAAVTKRLEQVSPQVPESTALIGGTTQILDEVTTQVEKDLRNGEGTALPISLLIMVVVFGGFLAALLPILGAIAAIAGAMATLLGFSYVILLDASTVNVVTVLGLGLCIDYGLLLVSRYREEMVNLPGDPLLPPTRRQRELALTRTMSSAGRTVLFSGVTVAVSLTGLMVFQATFLRAIGAAGVSVVAVAVLVALTLVPALLAVVKVRMIRPGLVHRIPGLGNVVRRLGDVAPEEGAFSRLARVVQRFPVIVLMIVLSALFVASLPVLRMEVVASGTALLPKDSEQRQLFDQLAEGFTFAATPTVELVAKATANQVAPERKGLAKTATVEQEPKEPLCPSRSIADAATAQALKCSLRQTIEALPSVVSVDPPSYRKTAAGVGIVTMSIRSANSENSIPARQLVKDIRNIQPGYQTWTTGSTSALVDYLDDLKARTPIALGIVVLATFVLLFLMTGSLMVPIKALLMNVVSLGASLGVLVWVFQDGNFESLLNFSSAGGIETFIPPMTLAFGFGLAMDYEVFLLSRISEYRRRGYPNDEAVVLGLQRSGRIITSAALIIVVVFAGFVAGKLLIIKETGVALAVAVAVDATLVRMLLVPATMTLLGEWNWWAPPFLRRLHNKYGIREED